MDLMVYDLCFVVDHIGFLPDFVERAFGCSHEPVEAIVEPVIFAVPGGALTARHRMHFEDFGIKTVHGRIDPGRQSGNPSADYNDSLFHVWLICDQK
jgi:hypothetical protein